MNTQIIAIANQKGRYVPVAHVQRRPERSGEALARQRPVPTWESGWRRPERKSC